MLRISSLPKWPSFGHYPIFPVIDGRLIPRRAISSRMLIWKVSKCLAIFATAFAAPILFGDPFPFGICELRFFISRQCWPLTPLESSAKAV